MSQETIEVRGARTLDKYEYKIRAEEIKSLISRKKYVEESVNQIIAAKNQIKETTVEYKSVTNYISDCIAICC